MSKSTGTLSIKKAFLRYVRVFNPVPWGVLLCSIAVACILITHAEAGVLKEDMTSPRKTPEWKTGYWLWPSYYPQHLTTIDDESTPDVLYILAGECSQDAERGREEMVCPLRWPRELPKASAYYAVLRYKESTPLNSKMIPELVKNYEEIKQKAAEKSQYIIGLQLDYDCPTGSLGGYAIFLKKLRQVLPREDLLSITALLDWFRPKTEITDVLLWVNEYVPQFYDIEPRTKNVNFATDRRGIAEMINASHWAPIFNSYGRTYRIGISSFGRISTIRTKKATSKSAQEAEIEKCQRFDTPIEVAAEKGLESLANLRSEAGESILRYKNTKKKYDKCEGCRYTEVIEMVFPSSESVGSAYKSAKAFGGLCSGVIFFRWPNENEAMVLTAHEVKAFTAEGGNPVSSHQIEVEDGYCSGVSCVNLYVRLKDRFPSRQVFLRVHSSASIEYVIPRQSLRPKLLDQNTILLTIPAYTGIPRIHVGRVVTRDPSLFSVEEWQP